MARAKSSTLVARLDGARGRGIEQQPCKLCETLGTLPADEAEALRGALERGIGVEVIYEALRDNGQQVPRRHITKHRKAGHNI